MDRKKRNTWILILVVAVLLTTGYCAQNFLRRDSGTVAIVEQNGTELARLDLGSDTEITIQTEDGGFNVIHVADGAVCVTDADCRDQICVHTGKAWEPGHVIACLPHRLIIFVEEEA